MTFLIKRNTTETKQITPGGETERQKGYMEPEKRDPEDQKGHPEHETGETEPQKALPNHPNPETERAKGLIEHLRNKTKPKTSVPKAQKYPVENWKNTSKSKKNRFLFGKRQNTTYIYAQIDFTNLKKRR